MNKENIEKFLIRKGFKRGYKGFIFLKEILFDLYNKKENDFVMVEFYNNIIKRYNISRNTIERNINNIIRIYCEDKDLLITSNKQFIIELYDSLILEGENDISSSEWFN
jgi:hypothetical protein